MAGYFRSETTRLSPHMFGQGGNSKRTSMTPAGPAGAAGNDGAIVIYENIIS